MSKLQINFIILSVLAVLVYMSAFVVSERELAIRFQFGEIKRSDFEPGLYWIVPFVNNVKKFDRRIQTIVADKQRYLTNEKKNVIIDAFVKWRIADVAEYYRATKGDTYIANNRLSQIVNNALKNAVSQRSIVQVISGERAELMGAVREGVAQEAKRFGINVVDVRIKKLDYSETISDSVFERMIKERATVAKKLRSEGKEEAKFVRADADRQSEEILADAYRQSQSTRGDGDAQSAETYAKAYGQNPEFYSFYRSLNAYRQTFGGQKDLLVLDPDSEFFRYFKNPKGTGN